MANVSQFKFLGDYIEGQWVKPSTSDGTWTVVSPADTKDTIINIESSYQHVPQACAAAKKAFYSWSHSPIEERKNALVRLKKIFADRAGEKN